MSVAAIEHRLRAGRLVVERQGVFAIAPLLDEDWGVWMGATLTAPGTVLTNESGGAAWGFWDYAREIETVTRPGSGGPRRIDGLLVRRSSDLTLQRTRHRGVPVTIPERTFVDIAAHARPHQIARALRIAVRERITTLGALVEHLAAHPGRRGNARVAAAISRYAELPLERARSGTEIRALELLREHGRKLALLNRDVAGEEADLVWPDERVIIEIDGGPWHLDRGEDARKQAIWESAGYDVHRIPADDVHRLPHRFLALAPNVQQHPS